jgi:hypothetical protein
MYDTATIPIAQALTAPSAAFAPSAARVSAQQVKKTYAIPSYPLVYGSDVWVFRPTVISQRTLPSGQIERIQVVSVGQMGKDDCGSIGELDLNIYNDCCQVIGQIDPANIRLGTPKQTAITDAFYVPCGDCCDCPGTGDLVSYVDVGDRIDVTITVVDEDLHAWVLLVNDVVMGTVWSQGAGLAQLQIKASLPASVVLMNIPDAVPVAPYMKLLPNNTGAQGTSGVIKGDFVLVNYSGVTVPLDNVPSLVSVRSDIDGTCAGLCVVKTVTNCKAPPSFKVKEGRSVRNHLEAFTVNTTLADAVADIALVAGQRIENTTTGSKSVITDTTVPSDFVAAVGDTVVIYEIASSRYLPDVYINLIQAVGGGLNVLINPQAMPDFEYLVISRKYCMANAYTFGGVVKRQPLTQFLNAAAPQSGLIITRRGNRTGFYPADPKAKPVRLFTGGSANNFEYVWLPWDERAINRLILHYALGSKCNKATLIVQDSTLAQGRNAYVEEPLLWDYVQTAKQTEALGLLYYNSILYERITISMRVTMAGWTIQVGEVFSATDPSWETKAQFSGTATVVQGDSVQASWEPVIASGQVRGDGTNQIIDPRMDFTRLVSVGDVVVAANSTTRRVTGVATTTLTLDGPYASDSGYKVLDVTPKGLTAMAYDPATNTIQTDLPVAATYNASLGRVVYTIPGVAQGSILSIADRHTLWRCSQVEPISPSEYNVRGTIWYPNTNKSIRSMVVS